MPVFGEGSDTLLKQKTPLATYFARKQAPKIKDNLLLIFSMNQTQSNSGWVVGGGVVVSNMTY